MRKATSSTPGRRRPTRSADIRIILELRASVGRRGGRRRVQRSAAGRGADPAQAWQRAARRLRDRRRVRDVAALLASLGHAQRLTILQTLLEGPAGYQQLRTATGLQAGPLYHHIEALRGAGLVGPKRRDLYQITEAGMRLAVLSTVLPQLARSRKVWSP